jgi:hypothetical protein
MAVTALILYFIQLRLMVVAAELMELVQAQLSLALQVVLGQEVVLQAPEERVTPHQPIHHKAAMAAAEPTLAHNTEGVGAAVPHKLGELAQLQKAVTAAMAQHRQYLASP